CSSLILATLLMGLCGLDWRTALLILAVPGLVLAAACWLLVRGSPREHSGTNLAEQALIDGGMPAVVSGQRPRLQLGGAGLLSLGMMLVYAFASTFQDQLYVYWIPYFLVEGRGLSATQMGLFTTLPLLGGAVGGILGGMLNDWLIRVTGNRRWSRTGVGFTG